jgi:hypothetical protein
MAFVMSAILKPWTRAVVNDRVQKIKSAVCECNKLGRFYICTREQPVETNAKLKILIRILFVVGYMVPEKLLSEGIQIQINI